MIAPTNVTDERLGGLGVRVDLRSSATTRPPAVAFRQISPDETCFVYVNHRSPGLHRGAGVECESRGHPA